MKNVFVIAAAAGCLVMPTVAIAGTATYSTKGGPEKILGNADYQGSYQEGTSVVTNSDGTTANENWTCIGVSQPPNAKVFDFHIVCEAKGSAGSYSMIFGCNNIGENGMQGCVGGLNGKTGMYEGKNGATTWSGAAGTGSGTMQWSD